VVEVEVCQKEVDLLRATPNEVEAELANAGAGVEDERCIVAEGDLDARGVPAERDRVRARSRP